MFLFVCLCYLFAFLIFSSCLKVRKKYSISFFFTFLPVVFFFHIHLYIYLLTTSFACFPNTMKFRKHSKSLFFYSCIYLSYYFLHYFFLPSFIISINTFISLPSIHHEVNKKVTSIFIHLSFVLFLFATFHLRLPFFSLSISHIFYSLLSISINLSTFCISITFGNFFHVFSSNTCHVVTLPLQKTRKLPPYLFIYLSSVLFFPVIFTHIHPIHSPLIHHFYLFFTPIRHFFLRTHDFFRCTLIVASL